MAWLSESKVSVNYASLCKKLFLCPLLDTSYHISAQKVYQSFQGTWVLLFIKVMRGNLDGQASHQGGIIEYKVAIRLSKAARGSTSGSPNQK